MLVNTYVNNSLLVIIGFCRPENIQVTISRGESEKGQSTSLLIYTFKPFSLSPLDIYF